MDILINLLATINVHVLIFNSITNDNIGIYYHNKVIKLTRVEYIENVLKHELVHALQHYVWVYDVLPFPYDFWITIQPSIEHIKASEARYKSRKGHKIYEDHDQTPELELQAVILENMPVEYIVDVFHKTLAYRTW